MRKLVLLMTLVVFPTFAAQIKEDPLERQMLSIAQDLRCTVCQNQPVSESDADLARDMRQIIREQLAAGKSRQEIIDYFVSRYGDYILMKPPYQGPGAWVWLAPLIAFIVLAIPAFVYLRRRQATPLPPVPELSKEDAARVDAAKRQAIE